MTTDVSGKEGYSLTEYTSQFCGTSASAPIVSGIIGMMISANPSLTLPEIYSIITTTADKTHHLDGNYNESGFSIYYGFGKINSFKSISRSCENNKCINPLDPVEYSPTDYDLEEQEDKENIGIDYKESLYKNSGCSITHFNDL